MKKLLVLSFLLVTPILGCNKSSGTGSHNPFDAKYEMNAATTTVLVDSWMASLDKTASYRAHISYSSRENVGSLVTKYYVADYDSSFEEDNFQDTGYQAYYQFQYVEGSLDASKSNISEEQVYPYSNCGRGLATIKSKLNYNNPYLTYRYYYYNDNKIGVYGSYSQGSSNGYFIQIMNKNGLVSYEETYEAEGAYTYKYIEEATFEPLR